MDVVREIISDNSESSDIEAIEHDDFSSSSSCQIDHRYMNYVHGIGNGRGVPYI